MEVQEGVGKRDSKIVIPAQISTWEGGLDRRWGRGGRRSATHLELSLHFRGQITDFLRFFQG